MNIFFEIIARFSGLSTFKCSETGFYKNEKGIVVVYTDGAAPSNGKRNAAGVAIGRSGCGVFFNEEIFSSFYNPSGLFTVRSIYGGDNCLIRNRMFRSPNRFFSPTSTGMMSDTWDYWKTF